MESVGERSTHPASDTLTQTLITNPVHPVSFALCKTQGKHVPVSVAHAQVMLQGGITAHHPKRQRTALASGASGHGAERAWSASARDLDMACTSGMALLSSAAELDAGGDTFHAHQPEPEAEEPTTQTPAPDQPQVYSPFSLVYGGAADDITRSLAKVAVVCLVRLRWLTHVTSLKKVGSVLRQDSSASWQRLGGRA